ncbi:Uncharacterized protein DAT39_006760 [Clarias magur]|uniref:Uncharacterized protein n=1 Tax=Clarias magur TaxID=1594786 RepID=A0A8J4UCB6_CLAMG|nr:Uncharacterized protein DAT39_006760 [Clarias magur]
MALNMSQPTSYSQAEKSYRLILCSLFSPSQAVCCTQQVTGVWLLRRNTNWAVSVLWFRVSVLYFKPGLGWKKETPKKMK